MCLGVGAHTRPLLLLLMPSRSMERRLRADLPL